MSLNVLVIPEDFRKDQYVLLPLVRRIFVACAKPNARVQICADPLLGGIDQALTWERIDEIIDIYPMVKIFLLIVDRDGEFGRRARLDRLEGLAADKLGAERLLLGENAWQEIEVWALAGQDLLAEWRWQDIRAEIHPKERYFEPFAEQRGLTNEPGEGRTTMGREAVANYTRVRSRCPEDIQALEARLTAWVGAH